MSCFGVWLRRAALMGIIAIVSIWLGLPVNATSRIDYGSSGAACIAGLSLLPFWPKRDHEIAECYRNPSVRVINRFIFAHTPSNYLTPTRQGILSVSYRQAEANIHNPIRPEWLVHYIPERIKGACGIKVIGYVVREVINRCPCMRSDGASSSLVLNLGDESVCGRSCLGVHARNRQESEESKICAQLFFGIRLRPVGVSPLLIDEPIGNRGSYEKQSSKYGNRACPSCHSTINAGFGWLGLGGGTLLSLWTICHFAFSPRRKLAWA